MNILTEPLDKITYDDIVNFCNEENKENVYLDYKADTTDTIAKTSAAMANTYGGTLVVGVGDRGKTGYPALPVTGLAQLSEEQLTRMILDNTFPLLVPQVKVYEKNGKYLGLIRIEPVNYCPVLFLGENTIRVRVNDLGKRFEDNADLDQLDWLWDKRKKSLQLYDRMFTEARCRYDQRSHQLAITYDHINQKPGLMVPTGILDIQDDDKFFYDKIEICARPLLPDGNFTTRPIAIKDLYSEIQVSHSEYGSFPSSTNKARTVGGAAIIETTRNRDLKYTEINQYGGYYHVGEIINQHHEVQERTEPITTSQIAVLKWKVVQNIFSLFINSSIKFYEKIGFAGKIVFYVRICSYDTMQLVMSQSDIHEIGSILGHYSVDNDLIWESLPINANTINADVLVKELEDHTRTVFSYN